MVDFYLGIDAGGKTHAPVVEHFRHGLQDRLVVVDDPRTKKCNIYGGTIAGPIFSKIGVRAAAYMNLQPTEPVPSPIATAASR